MLVYSFNKNKNQEKMERENKVNILKPCDTSLFLPIQVPPSTRRYVLAIFPGDHPLSSQKISIRYWPKSMHYSLMHTEPLQYSINWLRKQRTGTDVEQKLVPEWNGKACGDAPSKSCLEGQEAFSRGRGDWTQVQRVCDGRLLQRYSWKWNWRNKENRSQRTLNAWRAV